MMDQGNKVIILNKAFTGAYTEKEGNIAHEIIDMFLTDDGRHFFYNNPHGQCPKGIYGKENEEKKPKKYLAEYVLLCSGYKKGEQGESCSFSIDYRAKIKRVLHNKSRSDNAEVLNITRNDIIEKIIKT